MENANLIVGVQWLVCDMTQFTSCHQESGDAIVSKSWSVCPFKGIRQFARYIFWTITTIMQQDWA